MTPDRPGDATRTTIGAAHMLAPGRILAGRYRVDELIGVGGMGMVYRARDEELGIDVALKVLRAEHAGDRGLHQRFRQELVLARQVSHRNVVRIHDIGQDGDLWFLSMDYVAGRSLRQVLEEDGPLDLVAALDLARQLAGALAAAHREGVVHRDLKPSNVLLTADGRAYVTDFGIARSLAASGLTASGQVVGTPDYLAPEQAKGEPVDHRADLFALGLILSEALTGELPYRSGTISELLAQRISGRPRRPSELGVELPAAVERVIARCLEREPDRRYQHADELAADLERAAAGRRVGRPSGSWLRARAPRVAAGVGLVLVSVAAMAAVLWWRSPVAEETDPLPTAGGAPRHVVAVLPLVDETGREDLAWVSPGLSEQIAESLAESSDLRVVESRRVLRILEDLKLAPGALAEPELRQLGDLLEADRLVLGSVRTSNDLVRVDLRLMPARAAAAKSERLYAEAATKDELFDLAQRLAEELRTRLEGAEPTGWYPPPNAEAFESWSKGIDALSRNEPGAAAAEFAAAAEADPGFAAAWYHLAVAEHGTGQRERALEAARRAAELLGETGGRLRYAARARVAALADDPDRSREILEQQLVAYPHDQEALLTLAQSLGAAGLYEEALRRLAELVQRDPYHPRAWLLLGYYATFSGDARRARDDYLVRALAIYSRVGNRRGQADTLNALGGAAQELGEPEEAAGYYRRAADLHRESGDRVRHAQNLSHLARVETLAGDHAAAMADAEQALAVREALGDRPGIARAYGLLGFIEEQRGRHDEALERFNRGLELNRQLGDRRAQADSHSDVGFASLVLGNYDAAATHFDHALELYREAGDPAGEAFALQNRGQLELARGDWGAALRSLLDALEIGREIDNRAVRAVSHANIGRVTQLQGRYAAALESYGQALALIGEVGNPRGLAEFTLYEAGALAELGMTAAAEERLERARGWLAEGGAREQLAELARLEGELELQRGDPAAARQALARAAEEAAASGSPVAALAVELTAGRAELVTGDPAAAAGRLRSAAAEAERLGHVPLRLEAATELARAELVAGDPAAAAATARAALEGPASSSSGSGATWSGTYRLRLRLAEALRAQGETARAEAELERAQEQVERLRRDLEPAARAAFDRLPEVARIDDDRRAAA